MPYKMHPKLMIIDYYESLIRHVDIYTEERLSKDLESDSDSSDSDDEKSQEFESSSNFFLTNRDPYSNESWFNHSKEKATDVHKYLNNKRDKLISEIKRGQEEALKNYEKIKSELIVGKPAINDEEIDRNVATRLFDNEFMFLILDKDSNCQKQDSPFKLYLIVLDFYVNKNERQFIE